ncbi:unnamed protein product, partial [Arabidopsis halleri]
GSSPRPPTCQRPWIHQIFYCFRFASANQSYQIGDTIEELHGILYSILRLSSLFDDVKFSSISRCNNRVACICSTKIGYFSFTIVLAKQNYCIGNH